MDVGKVLRNVRTTGLIYIYKWIDITTHTRIVVFNSPLVQLELLDRVDVGDEGFEGLGVRLEELEEGDHAHGLHLGGQSRPAAAQTRLLVPRQLPFALG